MTQRCHRFRIETRFAPAELFKSLKRACEIPAARKGDSRFEFDWMLRKVEIIASNADAIRAAADCLLADVKKKTGGEFLLPRPPEERSDGSTAIVMGVLLQTADVYIDMILRMLEESGIAAIPDTEENTFKIAVNAKSRALQYEQVVLAFPLPPYLSIHDMGIVPKKN
ncbi:hypothetical protein IT570_05330 [Candidatus Sumerlaeota bacterium]|nr:hypothetical protein [Candidatus Sumerlaeota bacterium]